MNSVKKAKVSDAQKFRVIGVICANYTPAVAETLKAVLVFLTSEKKQVVLEAHTASHVRTTDFKIVPRQELGKSCDLLIVVGGDGSLLSATRAVVDDHVPIVGVNRGALGFLTDINPNNLAEKLKEIFAGDFIEEERFLLEASIKSANVFTNACIALNEITVISANAAKMIEFEIYIDDKFMCSNRANGVIVATPTGSTAYALSTGGPIINPNLNAVVLVPMFPHALSSRPIVLEGDRQIRIVMPKQLAMISHVNGDSQVCADMTGGDEVLIQKHHIPLRLIHPNDYEYYRMLRGKLGWGKKLPLMRPEDHEYCCTLQEELQCETSS